jgi:hypothetical protein
VPITLDQNPKRDALQRGLDFAAVRPALVAGRTGQLVDNPGQQQRIDVVDLLRPGWGQPEVVAILQCVAGGAQPGESGF